MTLWLLRNREEIQSAQKKSGWLRLPATRLLNTAC
jgi:hypothetical protein